MSFEHYFTLVLSLAILLPVIAVLAWLFETYLVAPPPRDLKNWFRRARAPQSSLRNRARASIFAVKSRSSSLFASARGSGARADLKKRVKKALAGTSRRLQALNAAGHNLVRFDAEVEEEARKLAPAIAAAVEGRALELEEAVARARAAG